MPPVGFTTVTIPEEAAAKLVKIRGINDLDCLIDAIDLPMM